MVEPTETAKQVKPIWKCEVENCNFTYPPTLTGYRQMKGHELRHANEGVPKEKRGYYLRDENTGEVLAQSIKEAMPFLMEETPPAKPKKVEPPISKTPPIEIKPTPVPSPPVPDAKKVETVPALQEPEKEPTSEAEPPSAIPKVGTITTVKSAGTFTYEITLPADAFTLFNLAKACGLELNPEKLFDEWVWDCIRSRFTKDYKKQLVLAPVEE